MTEAIIIRMEVNETLSPDGGGSNRTALRVAMARLVIKRWRHIQAAYENPSREG